MENEQNGKYYFYTVFYSIKVCVRCGFVFFFLNFFCILMNIFCIFLYFLFSLLFSVCSSPDHKIIIPFIWNFFLFRCCFHTLYYTAIIDRHNFICFMSFGKHNFLYLHNIFICHNINFHLCLFYSLGRSPWLEWVVWMGKWGDLYKGETKKWNFDFFWVSFEYLQVDFQKCQSLPWPRKYSKLFPNFFSSSYLVSLLLSGKFSDFNFLYSQFNLNLSPFPFFHSNFMQKHRIFLLFHFLTGNNKT